MKRCKTIAGYAIRQWMEPNEFATDNFSVACDGDVGVITDQAGGSLTVRYDPASRKIDEAEDVVEDRT